MGQGLGGPDGPGTRLIDYHSLLSPHPGLFTLLVEDFGKSHLTVEMGLWEFEPVSWRQGQGLPFPTAFVSRSQVLKVCRWRRSMTSRANARGKWLSLPFTPEEQGSARKKNPSREPVSENPCYDMSHTLPECHPNRLFFVFSQFFLSASLSGVALPSTILGFILAPFLVLQQEALGHTVPFVQLVNSLIMCPCVLWP